MNLYYLADAHDRMRLSTTGSIEPANDCQPWYFSSRVSAANHPAFGNGMEVKEVPAAETIPGAGVGAAFATAADTYRAIGPEVYHRVAAEVHAIIQGR
jgi:hypothetical protein